MKNIGFEFNYSTWVFPKYIYIPEEKTVGVWVDTFGGYSEGLKIPNEGLKFELDCQHTGYHYFGNMLGHKITEDSCTRINLIYKKKRYSIYGIDIVNLFQIIQFCGVSEFDGSINGTFKMSFIGNSKVIKLIPEGTREETWKSKISEIYHDRNIHFTKKMIPGHLYIDRNGILRLCVATDLDSYSDYFNYHSYPVKKKFVLDFYSFSKDDIEKNGITTLDEMVKLEGITLTSLSNEYRGKDVGKYLEPGDFKKLILGYSEKMNKKSYLNYNPLLLVNDLYKVDPEIRKCLIKFLKQHIKHLSCKTSYEPLLNELGI